MKLVIVYFILFLSCGALSISILSNNKKISSNNFDKFLNNSKKLSDALNERDPLKTLTKEDYFEAIKFSQFKITRGEAEQIFLFADTRTENTITTDEWDKFRTFFIIPFENCDKNRNYVLDIKEFTSCWKEDSRTKSVDLSKSGKDPYKNIMKIISYRNNSEINFADYLFIRKTLYAWDSCHSTREYIAKDHFACAIKIVIPNKYNLRIKYDSIYNIGIDIANDPTARNLDYIYYLRICYYTYFFTVFSDPSDGLYLEKNQFIRSVREDRLPNKLEEKEINIFYDLISNMPINNENKMNFETFSFFFHFHRLFIQYSQTTPRYLNKNEISRLLDDVLFPVKIVSAIDLSITNFTKSDYSEASLYFQKHKSNEKEFFSFRQEDKVMKKNKNYLNVKKNPSSRYYFFKIMSGVSKSLWSKYNYYHTFQLCRLFIYIAKDFRFIINSSTFLNKLQAAYDSVVPIINNKQRFNFNLYKLLPKEVYLDLLTFLCLENFLIKVDQMKAKDDDTMTETQLKLVMKEYGMTNIPDDIIDIAKKNYDVMKRRIYDKNEAIKVLIIVQSIASERNRNLKLIVSNKLKPNLSEERRYPIYHRRLDQTFFAGGVN